MTIASVLSKTSPAFGSSSFITDATGYAVQHLQPACRSFGAGRYLPFGETFVDQQNGYDSRYTFSAKEKDDETQYSYFGARYYDSDLSVWLSVDPMSDDYPNLSPYAYCANNPVMLVDPDGMEIEPGGSTKSEQRQNQRQINKALRRAERRNDTEFLDKYKTWSEDKENTYYVERKKGATELERSQPVENGDNQFVLLYDKNRRGKDANEPPVNLLDLPSIEHYFSLNLRQKSHSQWGMWHEATGTHKGVAYWRLPIGWGLGNYRKYNIWHGDRKVNPMRPMCTWPIGLVIRWNTKNGTNWIGIIYSSNVGWAPNNNTP